MADSTCSIVEDGRRCGNPVQYKARGWCGMHYQRWHKHGDPLRKPLRGDPSIPRDSSRRRLYPKTCPACGEDFLGREAQVACSIRCSRRGKKRPGMRRNFGEANPAWRSDGISYFGMHQRVRATRGKADHCERCGVNDPSLTYNWASLSDEPKSIWDFEAMCRSCHMKFDNHRDTQRPGWQGHRNRKLSADSVLEIRERHAKGAKVIHLAAEYGVSHATIGRAVSGETWGWLATSAE